LKTKLKILHLEDTATDAELVERELKKGNIQFEKLVVGNKAAFEKALNDFAPDIIISDHTLPSFDSLEAIKMLKQKGIEIPIILVSATVSDEFAVDVMKAGADDYIIKDRLHRLPQAILNAMEKFSLKRAKEAKIEELITSQFHLKEAQAIAKLGSWETDLQTFNVKWSDEIHRIFETDPETFQVTHEVFLQFTHPDDRTKVNEAFENSINSQTINSIEHRILTAKGSLKHVIENWRIFQDDNGKPIRALGTCQDITKQKIAEEEITKLSLVARKTSNAVIITDAEEKIQWVNDAFTQMTGFELNEIMGKKPSAFLQGPETNPEIVSYMRRKISKNQTFQCDIINYSKLGKKYWTNIKCQPEFDPSGKLTGFFSIQTDITKQKEAEQAIAKLTERMTLATNSAKIGIWDWDIVNDHIIWDKIMYQIFGIAEDKFSDPFLARTAIIHADDLEDENANIQKALSGGSKFDSEFRVIWPDKTIRYIKGDAMVIRDPSGNALRMIGTNLDITENKRLEKAVKTERDEFFEMFSKAPSAIGMLKGAAHVYEMANPLYLQITGKKDIIGKTVAEVFPEVIEQGFVSLLDHVYKTGETHAGTEVLIKLDVEGNGELTDFYMDFIYQAYRNSEGEIEGVFFFHNDITKQVVSRKKIEESEKRYRQIVETAQEGIWKIDEFNKTTFVNQKLCEILEYTKDEILGKEVYNFMDEEGKQIAEKLIQDRQSGKAGNHDFKFISKSGKKMWTSISANPIFNDEGKYKGSLAMLSNITEKKKLEAVLDKSNRLARIGSWEIDVASETVFWSDITKEIREVKADFVPKLSAGIGNYSEGENKEIITQRLQQCIDNGIPWDEELELTTFKGNVKWVRTLGEAEFVNGKCIKVYGSLQDITERKTAENERVKMIADIVQRNSDLEQFSYIVSHNLRAPVANILGLGDLLEQEDYTPEVKNNFLEALLDNVKRLDVVISDLNSILQVKGNLDTKKEKVILNELVDSIKSSIQNIIEKEKAEITTNFDVPAIHTVQSYLHSIFYNLIVNSIKYSKPGMPPQIVIRSELKEGSVVLTFEDNGLGIDLVKKREDVFGLYKRFHHQIEGKGMGLFLVKTQVELLGGKISIESKVNAGTKFTITMEKTILN